MAADSTQENQTVQRTWDDPTAVWSSSAVPAGKACRPISQSGLARLTCFGTCIATCMIGLQVAITTGLRRIETSDFGVTNRIVRGHINADIVITGSSRALVHYDPRAIAMATGLTTYNLGRNGSQTDMQLAVLKLYLRHNRKPRLVIHNLDLYSFTTTKEIYDPAQYLPYLDEEPIYAAVSRVAPDVWKWRRLPLYGYSVVDTRFTWLLGLKRLAGFEPREDHIDGFVPRHLPWSREFDRFAADHPDGIRTPVELRGLRDVEQLAALCREHGIPLLFVYSPEFLPVQRLELNRPEIFRLFARVSAAAGAPLWDFSSSPICANREFFYNSQHLNAAGAAAFSSDVATRLARELPTIVATGG